MHNNFPLLNLRILVFRKRITVLVQPHLLRKALRETGAILFVTGHDSMFQTYCTYILIKSEL